MYNRTEQPPSYFKLIATFENDPASKHLRLGQWFINRYMPQIMDDALYATIDKHMALEIIKCYYEAYQWEMA
jgi:hypothetical protein